MTTRTAFTFSEVAGSSLLETAVVEDVAELSHEQRSRHALGELMCKWGMLGRERHVLRRFSYHHAGGGDAAEASSFSSARHFHAGLAKDFLHSFFASDCVQRACGGVLPAFPADGAPAFRALATTWTSLAPLDRLVEHKVVRCVPASEKAKGDFLAQQEQADEWSRLLGVGRGTGTDAVTYFTDGEDYLPIVKRPERFLRGDVIVADELRALLLDTFSRSEEIAPYAPDADGDSDDLSDDDDDDLMCYSSISCLTRKERGRIFSRSDRKELLYHILWRLVAGGGAMNQFEDDFMVYKAAVRALFRTLVTSVRVTEAERAEDDGSGAGAAYVPRVQSFAFEVTGTAAGTSLWDATDGMVPSNLNYCYVVVNPNEQEVVLWFQAC